MPFYIPNILLAIPRNPVTAVGLPLVAGFLTGSPSTTKVQNSNWYYNLVSPPGPVIALAPGPSLHPFASSIALLSIIIPVPHLALNGVILRPQNPTSSLVIGPTQLVEFRALCPSASTPHIAHHTHPLPSHSPLPALHHSSRSSSSTQSRQGGTGGSPSTSRRRQRRGTDDSEDRGDCRSDTTSANLDSPSTKAMMERLLSAPDYFSLHNPRYMDDDDDDDSSGSMKFARASDDDEKREARPLRSVREQRERSKIKKLLGDDVDYSLEDFSKPRAARDFRNPDPSTRKQGLAGIAPTHPTGHGKQSKAREPSSPTAPGLQSSSLPSLNDHRATGQYANSQDRLLLPRVSQDSRNRSTSREAYLGSPPGSPRDPHSSWNSSTRPRVHALDALHPQLATVKRSKTTVGTVRASHLIQEEVQPPPRVSSRNALRSPIGSSLVTGH
ncbi:hypothetical protein NMY22_g18076 [Coprinellus aureogranulatus]|nr:hypothetical protein NMY22_g18076 [Coprinellus aureogranulatus]